MQIEIIENLNDIFELKPEWDALFEKASPGLFIHHSWVYQNYKHFQPGSRKLVVVYGDRRKLIGVFPFAIKNFNIKFLKYRVLAHGGSAVTDYSQFMVDPDVNRRLMIRRVLHKLIELQPSNWDFFKIDNLSDDDDTSNLFRNLMLQTLYAGDTATDITPIIVYNHEYQEAKKIANIQRLFRKIHNSCIVQHRVGTEISDQSMAEFCRLHRKSYPDSDFDTSNAQEFYKNLIEDSDFSDHVCLTSIELEGRMIAGHFGFQDRRVFYYYVPGYDKQFSEYGPGQYLLWNLINMANEKNVQEFDLLRGSERYKFNWTNKINTNYTVFGVSPHDRFHKKVLVNSWLLTKTLPYFRQRKKPAQLQHGLRPG